MKHNESLVLETQGIFFLFETQGILKNLEQKFSPRTSDYLINFSRPHTYVTTPPRSYPLVRASFREIFVVFGRFSKFSDVFGPVRMRSDMFGSIRMHRDALRCIKMQSDIFGNFRIFLIFLAVLRCFSSLGDYF